MFPQEFRSDDPGRFEKKRDRKVKLKVHKRINESHTIRLGIIFYIVTINIKNKLFIHSCVSSEIHHWKKHRN
jgi:hypothetical protein